jgi:ABC-type phosphate transport system substrate-binding protein
MSMWSPNFTKTHPSITLSVAATGSGTGIADAEAGLVDLGATDVYIGNASQTDIASIPVATSAQLIYYNLPSPLNTEHLNLNGTILAMIYEGTITTWDNASILAAQSPTVQSQLRGLSNPTIHPVKRADASGDTFLFTSFCYESWSGFSYAPSLSALAGDTIPNMLQATGNSGMITTLVGQSGSIGYVAISYEAIAASTGALQYAAIGDNSSLGAQGGTDAANYLLPTLDTISQDVNLGLARFETAQYGLALSLVLGGSPSGAVNVTHGGGGTDPTVSEPDPYPLVNLEYGLIKSQPTGSVVTSATLGATVQFLDWAISSGNYNGSSPSPEFQAGNFVPLTPNLLGYVVQALAAIRNTTYTDPSANVVESGSSLLYQPVVSWATNFSKADSAISVSAASSGSGAGEADAETGLVDIGATDVYLANASQTDLINFPLVTTADLIYYNLAGISAHLNLNGTILAMIYNGTITTWNNPLILAAQSSAVATQLMGLSDETIAPIARTDSNSDTYTLTSFLYMSWSEWPYGATTSLSSDTAVKGSGSGNSGMVTTIATTPSSIGYVDLSYAVVAAGDGLTYAALGDNASLSASGGVTVGNYILPTNTSILEDENLSLQHLDYAANGLALNLVLGGNSSGAVSFLHGGGGTNPDASSPDPYPLARIEYGLIKTAPTGPVVTPVALEDSLQFLDWIVSDGSSNASGAISRELSEFDLLPLVPDLTGLAIQQSSGVQVPPIESSTYLVTFTEAGLPSGASWSVSVNGTRTTSTTTQVTIAEPNGTYNWTASPPAATYTSPRGSFDVEDGPVSIGVRFDPVLFPVTAVESGLPAGVEWWMNLTGGPTLHSTNGSIALNETNGTYSYSLGTTNKTYASSAGSFAVDGAPATVPVKFSTVTYSVYFSESGLPSGTAWWVNVTGGSSAGSTTSTSSIGEPNGSYTYSVSTANKAFSAVGGSFKVDGAPASATVAFAPLTFPVTFDQSGLRAGASWSVTLGGVTHSSTNDSITFLEPNGSFSYGVHSTGVFGPAPANGTITVRGAAVLVSVTYSPVYSLTIGEHGLPTGTNWTVTLTGPSCSVILVAGCSSTSTTLTRSSNGASTIVFFVSNGTYSYSAAAPGRANVTGTATIAGASVTPPSASFSSGAASSPWLTYAIIAAVVTVIGVVAGLALMRIRGKAPPAPKPPTQTAPPGPVAPPPAA